jgi:hypothetical protein
MPSQRRLERREPGGFYVRTGHPLAARASASLLGLAVPGLPPLYAEMGIVTLRGRTPSPMADLIVRRIPMLAAGGEAIAAV